MNGQRKVQRDRTRQGILDAAAAVFGARGFAGATMREVAERSGVGQPLIVYHFGSKEALWKATVDRLWDGLVEEVEGRAEGARMASDPAVARRVLRAFVEAVARDPAWLQILLREAAEPGERLGWLVERHSRATYEAGAAFLAGAQERGLLPGLPTRHLLYLLVGGLTFVIAMAPEIEAVTGEDALSAEFLDAHVDTLVALLFPESGARGARRN